MQRVTRAWVALGALGTVVVVSAAVLLLRHDDESHGSCYAEAAAHVPAPGSDAGLARSLQGGNLVRVRDNGTTLDGAVEDIATQLIENGVSVDPLTTQAISSFAEGQMPTAVAGYDLDQMTCWVSPLAGRSFAARGSFDPGAVQDSELGTDGQVAAEDDRLAHDPDHAEADAWLHPAHETDPAVEALLQTLDEHDTAGFVTVDLVDDDRLLSAVGHAPGDREGDWDLVVVWHFDDSGATETGLTRLETVLDNDQSNLPDLIHGHPLDNLERSGNLLVLRAPLTAPGAWAQLNQTLDPALLLRDDAD